jgi:type II secretory pathway pseudopilin PulG
MKNKKRGFVGMGLVLVIVLGVAVVGGGAYYLSKNKEVKNSENILADLNGEQDLLVAENPTTSKVATDCVSSPAPSIKVLSPNGGEVFNEGDKITVKWQSCNNPYSPKLVAITLYGPNNTYAYLTKSNINDTFKPWLSISIPDTGSYDVTIPTFSNPVLSYAPPYSGSFIPGKNFKIKVNVTPMGYDSIEDYSDNLFTINSKKTILTTLPQYVGSHSDCGASSQCWPPVITLSAEPYSCNNIGVVPHTEGNEINEQRFINGKAYCIHSISSGYAGGRGYTYTYMIPNGNGTKLAKFGFVYPNCAVWQGDGTSKFSDCKNNQSNFSANLDNFIDSLMK